MRDLQENIVPAMNQNAKNVYLHNNGGIKILFVGNSITKHAPKPEMGWNNDHGMAASSIDKDYVHLLVEKIKKYDPNVSFSIAQVAGYERTFFDRSPDPDYRAAADFDADIVTMFFGANVSKEYNTMENPPKTFGKAYEELRNYLSHDGKATVIHMQGFYIRPNLDAEKKAVADKYGDPFIEIADIQSREETHGRFNHPSDLGMQEIADRFWEELEPVVRRLTGK